VLCNACGLFLKLHGKPRPISLKTDVIKSRNRVKATGRGVKRPGSDVGTPDARVQSVSLAASHPGIAQLNPEHRVHHAQPLSASTDTSTNSPLSRAGTPGLGNHNIAPQHIFDQVIHIPTGSDGYGPSPALPQFPFGGEISPDPSSGHAAQGNGHLELSQDVTHIKTRVSELEVINDLFRGRVNELESMLQERLQEVETERQAKEALRKELNEAKRRIGELEEETGHHRPKRLRVEDFVQDDASGSES
jgi:GATA-binding protein